MPSASVRAAEGKEIEFVTVLADRQLAVPLAEVLSDFSLKVNTSVSTAFGDSEAHKKKIEDGEPCELFITSDAWHIEQLKMKGMVDVYTIVPLVKAKDGATYKAAVVAGENMSQARLLLDFLRSPDSRDAFETRGFKPLF